MNKSLLKYLLKYPEALLYRHTLIDLFTETSRIEVSKVNDHYELETATDPFRGMLVVHDGEFCALESFTEISSTPESQTYNVSLDFLGFDATEETLAKPTDVFVLNKGDILNFTEDKPIKTTLGRFIINYVLLVDPFQSLIPYQNRTFKGAKALESIISDNILKGNIKAAQERKYGANILFLSSNPEYFAPTITKKALSTGANVKARKYELFKEHEEAIAAGDVVTIAKIEEELVNMDREYLSKDPSKIFLMKDSYFSNIRKKLFIIHGAVPAFGRKGEYDFIPNSLEEGWTVKDFPKIANEIRDGTYSRSTEVAKGGDTSNFILRIFQNTRIVEDDCGTTRGVPLTLHNENYKEYIDRNIIDGGKSVTLTAANVKSYIGKPVLLRSPTYCKAKDGGFCYKCTNKRFEETRQDTMATIMNTLGAMFSTLALKKVHNTAVSSVRLRDLNDYIL